MTDKGYYDPPRANGHDVREGGVTGGPDPDRRVMLLDGTRVSSTQIAEEDDAAFQAEAGDDEEVCDVPDNDAEAGALAPETDPADAGEPSAEDLEIRETEEADAQEPNSNAGGLNAAGAETPEPDTDGRDGEEEDRETADTAEAAETDEEPEAIAPEFSDEERWRHLRMGEALLFASAEPLRTEQIADRLPDGADIERVLSDLADHYAARGINLVRVAGGWAFRTAADLSFLMERERVEQRKLSRAALETLAIIAYHQPVTRAEIEDVRGVSVSKGTLDVLMEIGWVRVRGRRQTPGRPVTYGTSDMFLEHFGLDRVSDLPGLDELKAAGLLDTRMPAHIHIPRPSDETDEDDLTEEDGEEAPLYSHDDEVDDDRLAGEPDHSQADRGAAREAGDEIEDAGTEAGDSSDDGTAISDATADSHTPAEEYSLDTDESEAWGGEAGESGLTEEGAAADGEAAENGAVNPSEAGEFSAASDAGAPESGPADVHGTNGANGANGGDADPEADDREEDGVSSGPDMVGETPEGRDSAA